MFVRRTVLATAAALALTAFAGGPAPAQDDTVKIGLILPLTGPFAPIARQVEAGARTYLATQGDMVSGKRIELITRDDGGVADQTKRLAQELVVNDGVQILAGFGLTPLALATAPIATEAEVPMVVMAAATSIITEQSPFIVRTSFTLPQATVIIAQWAAENDIQRAATLVSDYGPGIDAETAFVARFTEAGGQITESLRVPLQNPDYAPFLQRVRDNPPDALFTFIPAGQGALFMRQFSERGLADAGIQLIGTGDVTDDDVLNQIGEPALGVVTSFHYSAAHDSPENTAFVEAFTAANPGIRPNFMGVGGFDGMQLIYRALVATGGDASGPALLEAMKGQSWMSPRGPITIDPETRDIVQNIYLRRVEQVDGEFWNIEFQTFEAVRDPVKDAR